VKVLDFGLAKALEGRAVQATLSNSPTLTMAATNAGVILGTAAYMSPEQAKGRTVDRRTDIFSLGCVIYEMLTGKAAFEGEDATEILARVIEREPDWSKLPPGVAPRLRETLRLCLEKDPRKRWRDAADVRIALESALNDRSITTPAQPPRVPIALIAALTVATVLTGALAIPALRHLRESSPREMRLEIVTPSTSSPLQFALSPDGRYIAFIASGDGPQRLWMRSLEKTIAEPLTGTENAEYPFWSADSRSLGFFSAGRLYRVDITGGPPQSLTTAPIPRGGTWNANGTILAALGTSGPIVRIDASGSEPRAVTQLDPPR
jgi:hypothetical protein